jgi:hypothetical protein
MRVVHNLSRMPAYAWGIALFVLLLAGEVILDRAGVINFKKEIDLFGIAGIPLFFVTIIELVRTHRLQAAELIRAHMSGFLTNDNLHGAFHDLIYQYSDDDWKLVKSKLPSSMERDQPKTPEVRGAVWKALETINLGREEGSRLYDPDFFQGSKEEKRLDAVLHFFDILAYNYRNRLISVKNIRGVAGYHLAVIGTREVISYLLRRNSEYWKRLPYQNRIGAEPPFENLRRLLAAVEHYNRKELGKGLQRSNSQESEDGKPH